MDRSHILGHSCGAVTAAILAADQPDFADRPVLENPAWGTGWGGWETMIKGMIEWFRETVSMARQELVATCREMNPDWLEEEIELWADSKIQVSP